MKHVILLLYIMSFVPGIGVISLGIFLHLKDKKPILKYLLYVDSFLLAFAVVDNFNYYFAINLTIYPELLITIIMIGLLVIGLGFVYYLTKFTYELIHLTFVKYKKITYFTFSVTILLISVLLVYTLYTQNIIEGDIAIHIGFFISNIFIALGVSYNAIVLFSNKDKIDIRFKTQINRMYSVAAIIIPVSIFMNIMDFFVNFRYAIPLSPIAFFLINLVGMSALRQLFIKKELVGDDYGRDNDHNNEQEQAITHILSQYPITERESEIISLINEGLTNQKIGEILFISPNTVKNHIYSIYRKMGIKNRYELMRLLSQNKSL
ncbi:helix-turn-helix transcriptional regulator [Vallitalea pronyensis]|uniref:Helix-turn-helix transcriptional regulator n=1 Tax=Vallitalea pronyensis TaxID=1348613 RepID=A0A8J8MQ25_9FIRM|nr:helix-turn-helix transcriptional regulator [Vallitalea pronyensis]QUI25298.1 helix-turn-helix transcriptional regulator [Vallitalea pronyensis]